MSALIRFSLLLSVVSTVRYSDVPAYSQIRPLANLGVKLALRQPPQLNYPPDTVLKPVNGLSKNKIITRVVFHGWLH